MFFINSLYMIFPQFPHRQPPIQWQNIILNRILIRIIRIIGKRLLFDFLQPKLIKVLNTCSSVLSLHTVFHCIFSLESLLGGFPLVGSNSCARVSSALQLHSTYGSPLFPCFSIPVLPAVQGPATGMAEALPCYSYNTGSVLLRLSSHHRHSDCSPSLYFSIVIFKKRP